MLLFAALLLPTLTVGLPPPISKVEGFDDPLRGGRWTAAARGNKTFGGGGDYEILEGPDQGPLLALASGDVDTRKKRKKDKKSKKEKKKKKKKDKKSDRASE